MRMQGSLEKTIMLRKLEEGRKRGRLVMKQTHFIRTIGTEELFGAVEDRTWWTLLTHRAGRSWSPFCGIEHTQGCLAFLFIVLGKGNGKTNLQKVS